MSLIQHDHTVCVCVCVCVRACGKNIMTQYRYIYALSEHTLRNITEVYILYY